MTTAADLVAAILADPDDTALRLVYADFLEGEGELDRSEFIRVQCELAGWPCGCDSDWERVYYPECRCKEKADLRLRERELLEAHEDEWLPFPEIVRVGVGGRRRIGRTFRRGFVEAVTLPWPACRDHLDRILEVQPVTEVTTDWPPSLYYPAIEDGHWPGPLLVPMEGRQHYVWSGGGTPLFRTTARRLLKERWPRIRTWNLPTA